MEEPGHLAWEASAIIKGLRLKGWTQARAARELRIPYHKFNYALKSGCLECVRDFISGVLEVPPHLLWPERFPPQMLWLERFPPAWGGMGAGGLSEDANRGTGEPGNTPVGCLIPRPGTSVGTSMG